MITELTKDTLRILLQQPEYEYLSIPLGSVDRNSKADIHIAERELLKLFNANIAQISPDDMQGVYNAYDSPVDHTARLGEALYNGGLIQIN